jgi:prepilin peptidase CpaA
MPPAAALVFLVATLPVSLWVAWSDMARMKIPNAAVLTLAAIFLVLGPLLLPLADWGWRWLHLLVVLAVGFVLNLGGLVGAGDAKFAAAMAPFVALADAARFLVLFAAVLLAAFATHRGFRALPAVRRLAPGWVSWSRADFPMGLALVGALSLYLGLAAFAGR